MARLLMMTTSMTLSADALPALSLLTRQVRVVGTVRNVGYRLVPQAGET